METPVVAGMVLQRLTRSEVAKHLGVSIATVRRMEGRDLHPVVDEQGVRRFEVTEVHAVSEEQIYRPITKRDDEGAIAGRVFELLRAGADLREIVITAKVPPRLVRDLYREWLVSLRDGEEQRRTAKVESQDARARARMDREFREWDRKMRGQK